MWGVRVVRVKWCIGLGLVQGRGQGVVGPGVVHSTE